MLKTACILSERTEEQGVRISVMSRHTLEDGKTPDKRIMEWVSYQEHMQELAPPAKLVGDYYRKELDFLEYEELYRKYLSSDRIIPIVQCLIDQALREDVTILCIEEKPDQCHRRILAEFCSEITKWQVLIHIQ